MMVERKRKVDTIRQYRRRASDQSFGYLGLDRVCEVLGFSGDKRLNSKMEATKLIMPKQIVQHQLSSLT